jgi:hypothetical protein
MAGTTVALKRHVRYESDAARSEKCSPCTTTNEPPSEGPVAGVTASRLIGATYSKWWPSEVKSRSLLVSSTA